MSTDAQDSVQVEADSLVGEWLSLTEVGDLLGVDIREVRRMLTDQLFVAVRRTRQDGTHVTAVPRALVDPEPFAAFPGTWTVLRDCGLSEWEAVRWLFTSEDGDSPVELMRKGHKTEVRRRAQALLL